MHSPLRAGSRFLVITVEGLAPGILSVEEDPVPISSTRKSDDHGSRQSEKEKKQEKLKKTEMK
jgi:hypothetical protein